ncbi:M1 family metallopeptidase [Neolewinella antarctica]|uniref:Aminopeptidase N n=1 Tax=Neolewinella antarctica TaxID=442734 RepID=A0ABX0XDE2_9BACT|nr:M1 family metallopeptidase [Neolewinella antarctica]NJC27323.1 aminopeptidase N [Neolewinella antarctica]
MMKFLPAAALLATLLTFGCNSQKVVTAPPMETRDLDTMTVTPEANGVIDTENTAVVAEIPNERPNYNPSATRTHDLLDTRLVLSFDWEQEMVIGEATLKLTPLFNPGSDVTLDAKNLDIMSVKSETGTTYEFSYDEARQHVTIDLGREYRRGEEFTLIFDYTAIPAQSGGSAAITSDKGLFFINPRGEEGDDKPRQIWTQGETENNSRWFPTIDKPNERTTQTMVITVADNYKTLSNGTMTGSVTNADGTRTDTWQMDQPHAPYLFMLTVGEFDVVEDEAWNGKPVNYYMEDGWKDHAKAIYPYTREMLTFFSDITGVSYPWPKYSQVAVRDYVSGAMENTTAVIFGEFMHGTERSLIDVDRNEKIVAHEMFHHWFGDYVTCESWANLTLNEGFANYSEYLWMEEKHGKDAAEAHMLEERSGYFGSLQRGGPKELIRFGYDDKEDMFDAHSYNKGGAVLHMLRAYVGDDAFFASLKKYLTDNALSAVEVDELRMAFEDTTGEDLNWFFDQWFLSAGHPALKLDTDHSDGVVTLTVEQEHGTENNVPGVFRLPTQVAILTNGSTIPELHDIVIDQRKQSFTFPSSVAPDVVILDPQHVLLANYNYIKSSEELAAQFKGAQSYVDRALVMQRLALKDDDAMKTATLTAGLSDPYHGIRALAMEAIETPDAEQTRLIQQIAGNDAHSGTRAAAIAMLSEVADVDETQLKSIATQAMQAQPYPVVAAGLATLAGIDPAAAAQTAAELESVDNDDIASAIAVLYSKSGDLSKLSYFEDRMDKVDGYGAINMMTAYQELLGQADDAKINEGVAKMKAQALLQEGSPWKRLAATAAINDLRESSKEVATKAAMVEELGTILDEIKAAETEPQLQQIYGRFGQ